MAYVNFTYYTFLLLLNDYLIITFISFFPHLIVISYISLPSFNNHFLYLHTKTLSDPLVFFSIALLLLESPCTLSSNLHTIFQDLPSEHLYNAAVGYLQRDWISAW